MSELKKKPKSENKQRKSKINNKNLTNGIPRSAKKKIGKKSFSDDGIAKSKQLAQKLKTTKSSNYGRPKVRSADINDEPRLCGNGKPMPSLSELEKMFEDSDGDDDTDEKKAAAPNITKAPSTPEQQPKPEEKLLSPNTISAIANRMLDIVATISDPIELLEDGPPQRIIKPKKRKKPDEPYIVGCKERPYVPEKPHNKFCIGDDKFGPEFNSEDDEDDLPKKRAKRGKKINISKSIFNAKSDEIAARLKECENSNESSDSNKTVAYEIYTPLNSNGPRTFSPLPSTSKDNETFVKNDQRFNESLGPENSISKSVIEDDIEILEKPYETIVINDTTTNKSNSKLDGTIIEIDDDFTQVFNDKLVSCNKTGNSSDSDSLEVMDLKPNLNTNTNTADDSVQVVDVRPASPIVVEDYYSDLDFETLPNEDICEVIDVDDIIAQNKAIIKKYSHTRNFDTVTLVDTSEINNSRQSNQVNKANVTNGDGRVKTTSPAEKSINRHLSINEQPSVIVMNDEDLPSHRPTLVENHQVDVEIIHDRSYHPTNQNHNRHRHQANQITGRSEQQQQHHSVHGTPIVNCCPQSKSCSIVRTTGDTCERQESTSTQSNNDQNPVSHNDSYQEQLKILSQFFERQRNGEICTRKPKKKNPRLSQNIISQDFMSWLQTMTNTTNTNTKNSNTHLPNNTQSPAKGTSSSSPGKTGKRIGDCPICMDSLSNKPIVSTICGHVFCMECLQLSIKSNGNKCPTCRKALKKNTGYHQIFL